MDKRTSLKIFSISLVILLITTILLLMQVNTSNNELASSREINTLDALINTQHDITLYMYKKETTTFEYAFWVYSNRWTKEGVSWKISNISFESGIIISCNPDKGTIYNGDAPVPISLTVTAFDTGNYTGKIEVQRIGDAYDKDTVRIIIVVYDYNKK